MAMTCSICKHRDQAAINAHLLSGTSIRDIAGRYHLARSSVMRHKQTCIKAPVEQMAAEGFTETLNLLKAATRSAIKTLQRHLNAASTPAAVQVRAAAIILEQSINIHRLEELEDHLSEIDEALTREGIL